MSACELSYKIVIIISVIVNGDLGIDQYSTICVVIDLILNQISERDQIDWSGWFGDSRPR